MQVVLTENEDSLLCCYHIVQCGAKTKIFHDFMKNLATALWINGYKITCFYKSLLIMLAIIPPTR